MADEIVTTYITTEDYLKDTKGARLEAERCGRVIVRDNDSNQSRLIINAHRVTEKFLID